MTEFSYRAYDRDGKVLSGLLRADSQGDLLVKLRNIGLTPFQAETHGGEAAGTARQFLFPRRSRIDSGSRARMARQLATLLKAGVALDRALRLLELQVPAGKIKTFLASAIEGVTGGQPLSKVLAGDHAFLPDEIGLIRAGEQAGSLAAVLEELAALLERRLELQGRLISALVYPVTE